MARSKRLGSRCPRKNTKDDDKTAKSMSETKERKHLTIDNKEDTSTKAFGNSGQKLVNEIEPMVKPMSDTSAVP
jgi:hypothetical protein